MSGNGRLKIHWGLPPQNNPMANALGYATHANFMHKYGGRYIDWTYDSDIVLTIAPADHFWPIPNKFNVLFTMWEALDVPKSYIWGFDHADAIIVPCKFCKDLFAKYTKKPIYVCWEGIEPERFPFHQRKMPNIKMGEKFKFLWIGAPNPRKGYPLILEAIKLIEKVPHWELYMKTTSPRATPWKKWPKVMWRRFLKLVVKGRTEELTGMWRSIKRRFQPEVADKLQIFGEHKNIIFDTRKLPFEDLQALYNSAHCFLLPTFGEGWGLTLCEAMATGCPSIATNITGVQEFFNTDLGYELKYEIKEWELRDYKIKAGMYIPDTKDFIERMIYVFQHYDEALRKGRAASTRIHNKFTWDNSAQRLRDILQEIEYEKNNSSNIVLANSS
jgi:glycosyltransferase involved in cell wall biosynthesis